MKRKSILIISPFFSPNVGGVETHLDDLTKELDKLSYRVYVHTYSPITTPGVKWKSKEAYGNVHIRRYRWFGKTLLHKLEKLPFLDFLYITPYLFLRVFIFYFLNSKKIDIIHAQGLNAAFIGKYLKKISKKKFIVSTHAIYELNLKSKTAFFIKWILSDADMILALSKASYNELISLGMEQKKLDTYKYWVNFEIFKPLNNKKELRAEVGFPDKFTVLFVGRLTKIKGVKELISVAKKLSSINFIFIGTGPLENYLRDEQMKNKNIIFLGRVENKKLPKYYNIADILCIPSQYKEGFGRVVMEAVACGLPVVGSNKGGIPEALDNTVSALVDPTIENLTEVIHNLYSNQDHYAKLKKNCRPYAQRCFSKSNAEKITMYYH